MEGLWLAVGERIAAVEGLSLAVGERIAAWRRGDASRERERERDSVSGFRIFIRLGRQRRKPRTRC